MKRQSLAVVLLTFAIHAFCSSVFAQPENTTPEPDSPKTNTTVPLEERPNILFAIADDWGYPHASAYGEPVVQTPAFDRIAREGVLFEHAFVSSPSCTASRGAILTGQHFWNLKGAANLWSVFPDEFTTYPEKLKERGYHTGHQGKAWGPGKTETAGRELAGTRYSNFAEFLENCPDSTPFCYWLGSSDPHRPFKRGSGKESGMDLSQINVPPYFPDSEVVRGDMADYFVEVQRFDALVGGALKSLEDAGKLDETIIVMTSDHGMPFPRCKSNLYDSGVRVPLAIRFGNGFPGGRKVKDLISLIELSDLFLEAAGVIEPLPKKDRGEKNRELTTLLRSDKAGWIRKRRTQQVIFGKERHVPAQETPNMGGYPSRGLRTPDYLLIENYEPERWPNGTPNHEQAAIQGAWYADTDNGPTKSYIIANRDRDHRHRKAFDVAFAKRPKHELFDLEEDPHQLSNDYREDYYGAVRQGCESWLHSQLRSHNDPREQSETTFDNYPYLGGFPKFDQEIAKWKRTDPVPEVDPSEFAPDIKVFLWENRIVKGKTETEGDAFGEGRNAPRYYRYLHPGLELQAADVARLVKRQNTGSDRAHFSVDLTDDARKRLAASIKWPGMHTRMATVFANGREMGFMKLYVINPQSRVSKECRADSFTFSFWVGSAEEADAVEATFQVIHKAQTLPLHAQSTAAVCFSRNGLLATTSLDRTVKLWDVKQHSLLATLDGFPPSPEGTWDREAVFSPDGSLLAVATTGKAIQVYQTETKRQLWRSDNGARSIAFAPNGKTFVTADWEDAAIKVWDGSSGKLLKTLKGTSEEIKPDCWSQGTVAYAPDGKTFATAVGGADMTAKFPTQLTIWDAESLTPLTQFVPQSVRIHAMAYSPDGKTLAVGGVGGTLRLVSVPDPTDRDAKAKVVSTFKRCHRGTIMGIAWSPDGKLLASCSREYTKGRGRIVVWRKADMTRPAFEWNGHGVTSIQFSPDGNYMASSVQDGAVTLWKVNLASAPVPIADAVPKATVEPEKEVGPKATLIATLALPKSDDRWAGAHTVAVSLDGKTVISAHHTSRSRIWDVAKQQAALP